MFEQEIMTWAVRLDDAEFTPAPANRPGDIDWIAVQRLAATHGLLPLLYRRLKGLATGLIPAELLDALSAYSMQNAVRNMRIWQRLTRILNVLRTQGIPAVPVKGVVLAQQAYGDLALRHFVDQDILLFNPTDLYPAYSALCAAGYRATEPITPRMRWLANNMHFWDSDTLFEIHWAMPEREYGCTLNGNGLASRMQQLSIYGHPMPVLSPEDTLLLHILHGTKHQWNRLIWIADIAYLLRAAPQLDWEALCARVDRLGVQRIFVTSLLLVKQLTGIVYPDKIQALCASDTTAPKLASYVCESLFLDAPASTAGFFLFMLRSRNRLRDKLFYLTYPREGDQNVVRLPQFLFPLYYLIRPGRMLGKIISNTLAERIRSD